MREELLRWLFDSLAVPFIEECRDGTIYYNAIAQQALKFEQGLGFGSSINQLVGNSIDPSILEERITKARRGTPVEYRSSREHKIILMPTSKDGVCAVVTPTSFDNSRLTWGPERQELVDGLSHELANALGAIAGWAQLAKGGTRVEEALELIEKASKSAWSISRQILGHYDEQVVDEASTRIDVSRFVNEAVRLIALKASQVGVVIRQNVVPGMEVTGKRDNVWSMIWNLMTNAVEAMPHGGTLTVEVNGSDGFVRLVVKDDGPGIDDKIKDRIFQPYFSTKKRGSGLGLALVKQSVDALNGSVEVETHSGEGTCFTVNLPRATEPDQKRQQERRSNGRVSGVYFAEPIKGRILLVEDDLGLREMVATALAVRGATVLSTPTATEALATEGVFDLALIDMQLPDKSGDHLLADLRASGRVTLGIIVTGRNRPPEYAQGGRPDGFLRKPFQIETLFECVSTVLGLEKPGETPVSYGMSLP